MPGNDPISTSNGRLHREARLTIGDCQIPHACCIAKCSIRRSLGEFASERVRPLTWIKGVGGQGGTIRRAITYAVSGILLTVFRYFAKLLAQQVVVASRLFRGKNVMKRFVRSVALVALLVGVAGISTPSRAEIGQVAVVFTKGGFIVGVGGGEGVLVFEASAIRSPYRA